MPAKPIDWNVVVVGAWNLAILTPQGIARRLFQLPPETPVEVQVAVDQPAPIRVVHSGLMVIPSRDNLVVQPVAASARGLRDAANLLATAVRALPETPMTAAGVNVRYSIDPVPDELVHVVDSDADRRLADLGFGNIRDRALLRTVAWEEGVLNCEWHVEPGVARAGYNFHLASNEFARLAAWIEKSEAMIADASRLTSEGLHVEILESDDAAYH
jgi:hypothetical protein